MDARHCMSANRALPGAALLVLHVSAYSCARTVVSENKLAVAVLACCVQVIRSAEVSQKTVPPDSLIRQYTWLPGEYVRVTSVVVTPFTKYCALSEPCS